MWGDVGRYGRALHLAALGRAAVAVVAVEPRAVGELEEGEDHPAALPHELCVGRLRCPHVDAEALLEGLHDEPVAALRADELEEASVAREEGEAEQLEAPRPLVRLYLVSESEGWDWGWGWG